MVFVFVLRVEFLFELLFQFLVQLQPIVVEFEQFIQILQQFIQFLE